MRSLNPTIVAFQWKVFGRVLMTQLNIYGRNMVKTIISISKGRKYFSVCQHSYNFSWKMMPQTVKHFLWLFK